MDKAGANAGQKNGRGFFKKDFYMVTAPWWLRRLYAGCAWDIRTTEKTIYLTFDDGPHPVITPFVLTELKKHNACATFFCIGDNIRKFPETYQQILNAGQAVGNHTMHHVNGWKTPDADYLADIVKAENYIKASLFRPPYGRLTRSQLKKLRNNYHIVMWSVLAGDWDTTITPEKCFERVKSSIYPGCIVVLHDSEKANDRMKYVLPRLLKHFTDLGYSFKLLSHESLKQAWV